LKIKFILNGEKKTIETEPDQRVIDLLREDYNLTGTKDACGSGECGACTIMVNGETRLSCLMLVAQLEGCDITTIENIEKDQFLESVQKTFVEEGAVQCGFCTPGMILTAADMIHKKKILSTQDIREGISGNLCRCTGYQNIVAAIDVAAKKSGKVSGL